MATASYEAAVRIAQELSTEEQRQLRAKLDDLLEVSHVPPTAKPFPRHICPGLEADLKAIAELAEEIGEAWQGNQSAAEAVSEMRQ